jgi:hypothetical protein
MAQQRQLLNPVWCPWLLPTTPQPKMVLLLMKPELSFKPAEPASSNHARTNMALLELEANLDCIAA